MKLTILLPILLQAMPMVMATPSSYSSGNDFNILLKRDGGCEIDYSAARTCAEAIDTQCNNLLLDPNVVKSCACDSAKLSHSCYVKQCGTTGSMEKSLAKDVQSLCGHPPDMSRGASFRGHGKEVVGLGVGMAGLAVAGGYIGI